jgi:hypothetical protein
MILELIGIHVDSENEIIENGVITVRANLSIHCKLTGQNNEATIILPLSVLNANEQTGVEMDEQRLSEANAYIASF